jgi:hypothetical protein
MLRLRQDDTFCGRASRREAITDRLKKTQNVMAVPEAQPSRSKALQQFQLGALHHGRDLAP